MSLQKNTPYFLGLTCLNASNMVSSVHASQESKFNAISISFNSVPNNHHIMIPFGRGIITLPGTSNRRPNRQ